MVKEKLLLLLGAGMMLLSCASNADYEGTRFHTGKVDAEEKAATSDLYVTGINEEKRQENGSATAAQGLQKAASGTSSAATSAINLEADYHFKLAVSQSNGGFTFTKKDEADVVWKAITTSNGFLASIERSHEGEMTTPFYSWKDSEKTTIFYQDGVAYFSNTVQNNHFSHAGKYAYALPYYAAIYATLGDYVYRLSDDLCFSSDGDENTTTLSTLIDEGNASVKEVNGSQVTFVFTYAAKGTYTLTFDASSGHLTSFSLTLDAAYEAKEQATDSAFHSGSVTVTLTGEFHYGNVSLSPLSETEKASYPNV